MKPIHDTLSAFQIGTGTYSVSTGDEMTAKVTILVTIVQLVIKAFELFRKNKKQ